MFGIGRYIKSYSRKKHFKKNNIHIHPNDFFNKTITCEENVQIAQSNCILNLKIGQYSYTCGGCVIINANIGRFCSIATNVVIGLDSHPTDWLSTSPVQYNNIDPLFENIKTKLNYVGSGQTIIGNDVWIGAYAMIKTGVSVGDGAIVGSGAVVTKDVPPYAIVAGVPAKILRYRFDPEIIKELLELKWWNKNIEVINELPFDDVEECIRRLKK